MTKPCKNRIKPPNLREQKTEALLVFIRTTLEQYFKDIDEDKVHFQMGNKEDNELIENALRRLLSNLQECVVNSSYLRSITELASKSQSIMLLAKKEEPLMVYYDAIVKQISLSLAQGENWIPEQLVICLLSEWVLEEEKSTQLYPFLKDIDYLALLNRYDMIRLEAKECDDINKTKTIMSMYKVSSELIQRLKNTKYKVNTKRVSKSRRKRK